MTDAFAVASIHAFPILIGAFIVKRKWFVVILTLVMLGVAVGTGQDKHLFSDLLAVGAGALAAWQFVD